MKYDKEHKTSHGIIVTSNTSTPTEGHRYDWVVRLEAPSPDQLDNIEKVEYVLHPTFPHPVRMVIDRSNLFAMSSSGWGEFEVGVKVYFKDGTMEKLKHPLRLFESKDVRK